MIVQRSGKRRSGCRCIRTTFTDRKKLLLFSILFYVVIIIIIININIIIIIIINIIIIIIIILFIKFNLFYSAYLSAMWFHRSTVHAHGRFQANRLGSLG